MTLHRLAPGVAGKAGIALVLMGISAPPILGQVPDSTVQAPDSAAPAPDSAALGQPSGAGGTGLQLLMTGRTELGGEWARFRPCDPNLQFGCNPTLLPRFRPDAQFSVQVAGSVFDRVNVDVDFDQTREFSAANSINIFYQGLPDEVLQRVEIGDVTFQLPDSRFLTEGVPAGNFGFRAVAEVGALSLQAVWAQQRGDLSAAEFQLTNLGGDSRFVRQDTLVVDDADYVQGQFFFLMDPSLLRGAPDINILDLVPDDAPLSQAPGPSPIQLYRFENDPVTRQQVEGYIQADGELALGSDTVRESGWFRYLVPDVDYTVHSSGLWVALRSPLRGDEMLAATYVAATGDTVGDYNPERIHNQGGRPRLRLLRASSPNHQPGRPTWELEMHQVYRITGSRGVLEPSVQVEVSLGELSGGRTFGRAADGREVTFLKLFGVDEESPVDVVDGSAIFTPGSESILAQPPVLGTFLVFPTLRPFAEPPPIRSLNIDREEALSVLAGAANRTIYENPDPFERRTGGLFQLSFVYTVETAPEDDALNLGAFAIRDGSERLFLDNRPLIRGVDYLIDYDIGRVTLLDPSLLDGAGAAAILRASWEQKTVFELAPTSVFGLNALYDLGDRGSISFLSMVQNEESLVRRPLLGAEPRSAVVGGLTAELHLGGDWLARAMDGVPGVGDGSPTRFDIHGELALSLPDPNTQKDVFLDDFDGSNDLALPRISSDWQLGSAPEFLDGMEGLITDPLDPGSAAQLVWQHRWVQEGAEGDSLGVFEGFFPSEDIDRQINVSGGQTRESGLLLTLGTQGGVRFPQTRWRSMTAPLSATGLDLSRSEFLEVYVAGGDSATLFIDLGAVSEDGFFVDDGGQTSGVQSDGDAWGLGLLDQEADPRKGEIWSNALDQIGLWGESCEASLGAVYREGDPRANCNRGNGRADTEDLDNDGTLDTNERTLRFAVPLDGTSTFLTRDRSETGTRFRLYRIPLRGPDAINVQGRFTEADWRGIKHVRLTFASNRPTQLIVTRARVIGSRWANRGVEGVLSGVGGDTLGAGGRVSVSQVSQVTRGDEYQAPPGVVEALDDLTSTFSGQGFEFNEQSIGIRYEGVAAGDRAEVFNRFPQRPRNFLTYRQARIWAVAREGDWGVTGPSWFFLKVGSDANNFYLYRTRLPGGTGTGVQEADWLPEIVVDFNEWLTLRRQAEELFVTNPPNEGDPPVVIWSADSTYAVVLQDRARAPTLAAVRELSLGVLNQGVSVTSGEVWVDELRLSGAVRDPGAASWVEVDLGNDVWGSRLSVTRQGPFFHQLRDGPTYLQDNRTELSSTLAVGRLIPDSWRLDVPLTVSWVSADEDPLFLRGTDIRAGQLFGLRQPGLSAARVSMAVRRRVEPGQTPSLLDGLNGSISYARGNETTITTEGDQRSLEVRMGYQSRPEALTVPAVPGFMRRGLETVLPNSWAQELARARLRWTPEWVSLRAGYTDVSRSVSRFDQILTDAGERLVVPVRSPRQGLETSADVRFRPLPPVLAEFGFNSVRDLLPADRQVAEPEIQALLARERQDLGPFDLGWETRRSVRTRLEVRPTVGDWLSGRLGWATRYGSDRNATFVRRTAKGSDTAVELTRSLNGNRTLDAEVRVDPARVVEVAEGGGWLGSVTRSLRPLTVSWSDGLAARFTRGAVDPGLSYQFGMRSELGFRVVDGDTAAVLTDRSVVRVGSGVRLAGLFSVDAAYSRARLDAVDRRADRRGVDRTWPDVRLRLERVPLPEFLAAAVARVGASGGIQRTLTESSFSGAAAQRRVREDRRIPLDVIVDWHRGVRTSYRATFRDGLVSDPTGQTRADGRVHNVALSMTLSPRGPFQRLDGPVRLSVRYAYSQDVECRLTAEGSRCVPFVDQLNRSVNVTMDSRVSEADVGLQVSYVDRRSHIGQRIGASQLQLLLFGRFQLSNTILADR